MSHAVKRVAEGESRVYGNGFTWFSEEWDILT